MLKLIGTRLALAVPQLLLVSALVFLLVYLVPGSAAALILGDAAASPEEIARVEAQLGLDRPFFVRLFDWIGAALQGDLGTSLQSGRPVAELIAEKLPATLSLIAGGLLVAMLVGIGLGVLAGTHARRPIDRGVTAFTSLLQAIPEFWLGLLLVLVFVIQLGVAPVVAWVPPEQDFWGWARGLILPALALGAGASALIARQTRTAIAAALSSRYADTLTAAGVPRQRIIWVYALKNAMVPVLAASALAVSILFGTSLVMERVFAFPGVGSMLVNAVIGKDFPLVQGTVLVVAIIIIAVNLIVDICYGIINPKARPQ
ncbi:ABC transporter permease [Leucobacter luti]|uniref:Peptide/nickel transport system permease protein n=1 Tax=Leucobacter luti TaxID=340320 RepID=A0A4Q7U2C1_9MICO|nr:ABC transporter permease [Leucobacter luti]MBL3699301.1 ABC transporter permease [Leucobacter luti]RZT66810.1 peptide/nickel transport system permease protein [Leucobacter luti]